MSGRERAATGIGPEVKSTDPLLCFFYLLLRDHLRTGAVEELVEEVESGPGGLHTARSYSNGWLAQYAENISKRLRGAPYSAPPLPWADRLLSELMAIVDSDSSFADQTREEALIEVIRKFVSEHVRISGSRKSE